MEAELPGAGKEDIVVELTGNTLKISAEKKHEFNEERENYIRRERRHAKSAEASMSINIDDAGVNAEYKDGVLTVTLSKKEIGKNGSVLK